MIISIVDVDAFASSMSGKGVFVVIPSDAVNVSLFRIENVGKIYGMKNSIARPNN